MITVVRYTVRAQWPGRLRSHVAKNTLRERYEIRAITRIRLAKLQRAVACVLTPNNLATHRRRPFLATTPGFGLLAVSRGPKSLIIDVIFESHCRRAAIMVRIVGVVCRHVRKVLHMNLDRGGFDTIGMIEIKPRASRLVTVVADNDVRVTPMRLVAVHPHIARPAALSAIRPRLCYVGNTNRIVSAQNLYISRLFSLTVECKVCEASRIDMTLAKLNIERVVADHLLIFVPKFYTADGAIGTAEPVAIHTSSDADIGGTGRILD